MRRNSGFRRNTLDLDPVRLPNGFIRAADPGLMDKIKRCPFLVRARVRESASGSGYHIELWCNWDCDLCRLVYDSPRRFGKDLGRPVWSRDVLWQNKVYRKGGHSLALGPDVWVDS